MHSLSVGRTRGVASNGCRPPRRGRRRGRSAGVVRDGKARPPGVARAWFYVCLVLGAWCLVPGAAGPPGPPPPWRFIGRYAFVIDFRYVVKRFLQDERAWFN